MTPHLAIFFHARLSGGNANINPATACPQFREQMNLIVSSGLYEASHELYIGLNGEGADFARQTAPAGATLLEHGNVESLLPTCHFIKEWLPKHPDWYVCFHHTKGITHPADPLNVSWRRCMELCVIENWRGCVEALDAGCDSAGAHWLTPEKYGATMGTPIWGGMFFWAKAQFLMRLPKLPRAITKQDDWYLPERWIGSGTTRPKVQDFADHWPNLGLCTENAK
jgi:hypothetical protein